MVVSSGVTSRFGDDPADLAKLEPPSYILPSHALTHSPAEAEDPPSPTHPTDGDVDSRPPLTPLYPPNLEKHFKVSDNNK